MSLKALKILLILAIAQSMLSCEKNTRTDRIDRAVYVWNKTHGYEYLDTAEIKFLRKKNIHKLYCKLTDVAYDEIDHAYPLDTRELPYDETMKVMFDYIPCVFFTNEVMLKSTHAELDYMAQKISQRMIKEIDFSEYQLDCDWSEKSKDNYFYFIKKMKEYLKGKTCSITLRLYQYKYVHKTGIPPADRAMLMLYNFNTPKKMTPQNSIFDKQEALRYKSDTKYPLPVDFALPSFCWTLVFDSQKNFLGFVKSFDLVDKSKILGPNVGNDIYLVQKDTVLGDLLLRKGQYVKKEVASKAHLKEAYSLIDEFKNTDEYTVAVFDLSKYLINSLKGQKDEDIFE